jgi:hypothetical protein
VLLSISAVFTQGDNVIYDTDTLNTLKQYLVVTAAMTDSTTRTVTDYTLSGTLTVGTSTITVSYGGKTTTFNVTVSDGLLLNDILTLDGIKNTRNGHDAAATTWEDLSGSGNDFANNGTETLWTDNSAVFNGSTTSYKRSGVLFPTTLTEFTVELSVKVGNIGTSTNGYIVFRDDTSTWNKREDFVAIKKSSGNVIQATWGIGTDVLVGDDLAHVTFVFKDGKIHKYLNGQYLTSTSVSYSTAALGRTTHYIGVTLDSMSGFTGNVYRFGISSSAFTDEEIAERYRALNARFG